MKLKGKLFSESPIYRGNTRKTLFTRDSDGTQKLISLAGEIEGTAQALMDAFIGTSKDGRNKGLINELWIRLFKAALPNNLITKVECKLNRECYPRDNFFDLRMGIKLDEDRWAAEANANYKMETLFRHSYFDFVIHVNDSLLKQDNNDTKLFHILEELKDGRFWFGAGKSKGLGRCHLEMEVPFSPQNNLSKLNSAANHLSIKLHFDSMNPILVGWNWGKVDPQIPAFAAIEGRQLIQAMRNLPEPISNRLELVIGGPILSPDDWKKKFASYLPRIIAIFLREKSLKEGQGWVLPETAIKKLSSGKFPLSAKILAAIKPLCGTLFSSEETAEEKFKQVMGKKANLVKRVMEHIEQQTQSSQQFDLQTWHDIAKSLGLSKALSKQLETNIANESKLVEILAPQCIKLLPQFNLQIDQQLKLLQSDAWIEVEIANREDHSKIKSMILEGKITEKEWNNRNFIPDGMKTASWQEFLSSHANIQFRFLTNPRNLNKSITNDQNFINFLKAYRNRTRQELSQSFHTDFRPGGPFNREISKKYGKPYDTMFMRMLIWKPSTTDGQWEVYIPGSTIKGAFRKRASQIMKTLWGETPQTTRLVERLFGAQGKRGLVFFSDAYLIDPEVPNSAWCSMDGVKMDSSTGKPIEEAKADYLFAYGKNLSFKLELDLQDISERDNEALSVLGHLIMDFNRGDIPLGGSKTNGMGWSRAQIDEINWFTRTENSISNKLFGNHQLKQRGYWKTVKIKGEAAFKQIQAIDPIQVDVRKIAKTPPRGNQGFISHRYFGGHCGILSLEAEILTPTSIKESGEPSFRTTVDGENINGWDFFSFASPEESLRKNEKVYALPSKSIRGMIRNIYSITSNSNSESADISKLNPSDSLFGWVGAGPNQAIAGRLSFNFARFDNPQLTWYKIPYPYGNWQFENGQWKNVPKKLATILRIGDNWRYFPHAPLVPAAEQIADFIPDTVKATYLRAILPGARCHFAIRFWNLTDKELQRLMWCLVLEDGLAHKMGRCRYLGFGSLKILLKQDSYLIGWENRYAGKDEAAWRKPLLKEDWITPDVIENYKFLREALNAKQI